MVEDRPQGVAGVMRTDRPGDRFQKSRLDAVDDGIARLSFLCDIRLLEPGNIERVIAGNRTVRGRANPIGFKALHSLAKVHCMLAGKAPQSLGVEEPARKLAEIRARLQTRYNLGGEVR
jgi:hypothetical protein